MVDITLLELRFDEVEFEGSATAALPFGSETAEETSETVEESIDGDREHDAGGTTGARNSDGGGRGRLLALVGVLVALVGLLLALNHLRGEDPEVEIQTAGEHDNGDRPVGVTVDD